MVETGNLYRDNVSRLITWGHWFTFFNILAALLIATRYLDAISWPSTTLGVAYLIISWIGHFSFLGFSTYLITLFPLAFLLPKEKPFRVIATIIATLALLLLLIDTQIFRLFKFHINWQVWQLLLDQRHNRHSEFSQLVLVALPLLFLLQQFLSRYVWRKINRSRRRYGNQIGALLLSCFILTHLVNSWADANLYYPITMQRANFPLSYPMTARTFLAKHGWLNIDEYNKRAKSSAAAVGQQKIHYPQHPLVVTPPATHHNLLIVVVDSLRADMLNRSTMPYLQHYAKQHNYFANHLSGSNSELMGMFTLFYGLPGNYYHEIQRHQLPPLLFDEMLRQDYQFSLFGHTLQRESYQRTLFAGLRQHVFTSNSQSDTQLLLDWQTWLQHHTSNRPWFSLITLSGTSSPLLPNDEANETDTPVQQFSTEQARIEHYQTSLAETDRIIAQLINTLKMQQLDDNTIVVITANHGDSFSSLYDATNNYSPAQVQVPLIIAWPMLPAKVHHHATSHLDLAPTLMNKMLGVTNPARDIAIGQRLFDMNQRNWLLVSNEEQFALYQQDKITQFNKQGDIEQRDRTHYQLLSESNPDMVNMIQAMDELNRFYHEP